MAEISDLRIIQLLQDEHDQIREQFQRLPSFYDPTESHAEILKNILNAVELFGPDMNRLRREVSYLKSQIQTLEMEKNSEKSTSADPNFDCCSFDWGYEGKAPLRQGPDSYFGDETR